MADLAIAIKIATEDQSSGPISKIKSALGGLGDAVSAPGKALGGLVSGLGSLGLAAGGLGALASGIGGVASSMVSGNAEMETFKTQLGTMMGSTDAATERIKQLAKIGAETPFELPQLVASEKILMGFGLTTEKTTKLTGKSLDEFRTSLGDMAAGTGTDLAELTNLWGKFGSGATGEALSRLQELGIVTREQLGEVGVEFSKSGELLSPLPEAMEAAMKIADQKFGGGMKALSATFSGQMSTLADNFNQAKTLLMAPIFDVLKGGLIGVNELLSSEAFQTGLTAFAETGAAAISTLIDVFGTLSELFMGGDVFIEAREALGDLFPAEVVEGIITTVDHLGGTFDAVLRGDLADVLTSAQRTLEGFGQIIVGAVEAWAASFVAWVDGAESGMMGDLAVLWTNFAGWMQETGFAIIEKLAVWAGAFVDWVGPKIPPLLVALGGMLAEMVGWMLGTALPTILLKLAEWGLAFVEWVIPRIPPLLLALGELLVQLSFWIADVALPAIVSKLLEWGAAFVEWVPGALVGLLFELGKLEVEFILWIAGAAKNVATGALDLGKQFVQGIQDGINGALAGFWAWLQSNFVDRIPSFVRELLNINSPSGVFMDIGRNIVEGLRVGMEQRLPSIEDVVSRLTGTIATTGEVTDWLRAAMQIAGVGGDWLPGLQRLVQWESSGNPRAVNPTSVGGQHATGLLQTLPSTFRGYAVSGMGDIFNPIHNAAAAIRYIMDTYGSVYNIPGIRSGDHSKFPGYATGGIAWQPQLAYVAEREPELIVPLSRVRSGGDPAGIAAAVAQQLAGGMGTTINEGDVIVSGVGLDEVASEIVRRQQRQSMLRGGQRWR